MGWWASVKRFGFRQWLLLVLILGGVGLATTIYLRGMTEDIRSHASSQNAASAYESDARIEANSQCRYLTGADQTNCVDRAYSRARDKQREEYELEADRRNATWTAVGGQAAAFGMLYTLVTVLVLFLTFQVQMEDRREARKQFLISRRHDRESLEHSQRVSDQELRPYVFVDRITPEEISERDYRIVVWLKNFGKTPARNMEAVVTTYVTRNLAKLQELKPRAHRIELGTAGPDGCRRAISPLTFSKKEWEAPAFERAYGVVRIKYWYTDDTGSQRFEESIDYYTDPIALTRDEPMFYLLTKAQIRYAKRVMDRQGELLPVLRRIHRRRMKAEEKHRRNAGDDGPDHF
jgi:hypothetical protein